MLRLVNPPYLPKFTYIKGFFLIVPLRATRDLQSFKSDSAVYAHHGGFFILTLWCMHITEVYYSDSAVYAHHGGFLF